MKLNYYRWLSLASVSDYITIEESKMRKVTLLY